MRSQELSIRISRDATQWRVWRCDISHRWLYEPAWWDSTERDGAVYPCNFAKTIAECIDALFCDPFTTEDEWLRENPPRLEDEYDGPRGREALDEELHDAAEARMLR